MGVVTNIIDALRRRGAGTQRSALARQDQQLEGKSVIERRREIVTTPDGQVEAFIATLAPVPETVEVLSEEQVRSIRENAALAPAMFAAFLGHEAQSMGLPEFDQAFERWVTDDHKRGYSNEAVVEILGAAFGEYCVARLNMCWIKVVDEDGIALGIEGREVEFRSFPYHVVSKRINDGEFGFFAGVYVMVEKMSREARPRVGVLPGKA